MSDMKQVLERVVSTTSTVVVLAQQLTELTRSLAKMTVRKHGDVETGAVAAVALADASLAADDVKRIGGGLLKEVANISSIGPSTYLEPAGRSTMTPPDEFVISSVTVERKGNHELVHVWTRGAYCGELLVSKGDGFTIANKLGMFVKADADRMLDD